MGWRLAGGALSRGDGGEALEGSSSMDSIDEKSEDTMAAFDRLGDDKRITKWAGVVNNQVDSDLKGTLEEEDREAKGKLFRQIQHDERLST